MRATLQTTTHGLTCPRSARYHSCLLKEKVFQMRIPQAIVIRMNELQSWAIQSCALTLNHTPCALELQSIHLSKMRLLALSTIHRVPAEPQWRCSAISPEDSQN